MTLEQKLAERRLVLRFPPAGVIQAVEEGRKFIVVDDSFSASMVPMGYTLIDMKHQGSSMKTLVPQSLLYFMANPGEGDTDSALDELADFYGDAEDVEDEMIENGQTSVQQANWSTIAREGYRTYLINRLAVHRRGAIDSDGEPVPEFNEQTLRELGLDDTYVANRVKAMAAVALGKTAEEVKTYGVGDVLKHITIKKHETRAMTKEEFKEVACWAGSHYEIKDEFRNHSDVEYDIERRHNRDYMAGNITIKEKKIPVFDAKIEQLEREIHDYRAGKNRLEGRHDAALIRMYANLAHIAKENPKAQLDIQPPARFEEEAK